MNMCRSILRQNLFAVIYILLLITIYVAGSNIAQNRFIQVGKLQMQPIGFGSWAWGNKFLWGYSEDQDDTLKATYDYLVSKRTEGIWIDTAEVYGENHRSEELIGKEI